MTGKASFKPGDRVVYTSLGRPTNVGGTVIRVDSFPNPAGTWPLFNHYLICLLYTSPSPRD